MTLSQSQHETITQIRQNKPITPLAATTLFNSLPPLPAEALLGEWAGTCALTGHSGIQPLLDVRWVGKRFSSLEDVNPIISLDRESEGKRIVNGFMGKARVREVKYNGVVSAGMIYNDKPIIDYFRRVDERTVMGVMDALGSKADHGLFFILEQLSTDEDGACKKAALRL